MIGMHVYKEPIEPEVGLERVALARRLTRGHDFILAGPDTWTSTATRHPACFEDDGLHPNDLGMQIMAEGW